MMTFERRRLLLLDWMAARLVRIAWAVMLLLGGALGLAGCGMPVAAVTASPVSAPPVASTAGVTSVTPSATGSPNTVVTLGNYAFVSEQGVGLIYSYNISSGTPVGTGTYSTPCTDPSGMVTLPSGSATVLAVVCYDTGSLLTLTVQPNGTLAALGAVSGLPAPFPGIALDGTDVYIPLFGVSNQANGAIAKVSLANPASPAITAVTTLVSSPSGGTSNPSYVAVNAGYVYAAAGSESLPAATTSTLQVVQESSMALVGSPLVVDHSPQSIAVSQGYAFVTYFDAEELQSFDVSNPAVLQPLQTVATTFAGQGCSALPITVFEMYAYVGCYNQAQILRYNIADPTHMVVVNALSGISTPERLAYSTALRYLVAVSGQTGGSLYQVDAGRF